jgi:hypothetical protein
VASASHVAQALYMRAGMYGIGIGYRMTGPSSSLLTLAEPDGNRKRIVDCSGWLDRIEEMDRDAFGASRREDHAYYLNRPDVKNHSFGLTVDGELDGYGYVDERGWVGPIASRSPEGQLPLLRIAAEHLVKQGNAEVSMWVPSLNHVVMQTLLTAGWKSEPTTYFLSSEPFGRFDRYLPSGGLLL